MTINEIITPAFVSAIISVLASTAAYFAIKARFDSELEIAKKDLIIEAKRDEISFSELRKKQAEIISDFYEKFASTYIRAALFVSVVEFDNNYQGRVDNYVKAFNELQDYYLTRKIFIPESTCKLVEQFLEEVLNAGGMRHLSKNERVPPETQMKAWQEGWDRLSGKVSAIKMEIENEFRSLLGM